MRRKKWRKKKNVVLFLSSFVILFLTIAYSGLKEVKYIEGSTQISNYHIDFDYTGTVQEFVVPKDGVYRIECWGAQGGSEKGGKGAYTSGKIELTKNEKLYIYVGEHKQSQDIGEAFNGGGCSQPEMNDPNYPNRYNSGGGATDIRLVSGDWNSFASLKSRIMVAAGGGGAYTGKNTTTSPALNGGSGGALIGQSGYKHLITSDYSSVTVATGGTQTSGGNAGTGPHTNGENGGFGYGGIVPSNKKYLAGGGGGYYGGGSSGVSPYTASTGAGGSSFISGYSGCNAIDSSSTESQIIHTGDSAHYSGKIFTNSQMIDGASSMPNPRGNGTIFGNEGNGYVRITFLSE